MPRARRARIVALGGNAAPPPEDDAAEAEAGDDVAGDDVAEVGAEDILNSPVFLRKKLEVVQRELSEAREAAEAAEEGLDAEKKSYVRLAADFENYRRRSAGEVLAQESVATAKVVKEILGVLDNFERAISAVKVKTEAEKVIDTSYQGINKQLLSALSKMKVEAIESVGEVFDPAVHDAINRCESEEYAEGVVCQQFQRGYMIGETLIRPAMVMVSEGPGPEGGEEEEEEAIEVEEAAIEVESEATVE